MTSQLPATFSSRHHLAPTPSITSTKFCHHNFEKRMNSRKQMGTVWQLKNTHFVISRLRSDKQTQRKFLKNKTTYAPLDL